MVEIAQILSAISITLSSAVVLTAFIFPRMSRWKIFMPIVTVISFCDICGNLPYLMGICPSTGQPMCAFQGFLNLYFYPVSWLYSTLLMHILRQLFLFGTISGPQYFAHMFCCITPLVFTLLMLTTNTYGQSGLPTCICTIGGVNQLDGKIWHAVTYYGLLLCCCGIMLWCFVEIRHVILIPQFYRVGIILIQYPLAMIVLWFPYAITNLLVAVVADPIQFYEVFYVTQGMKIMHGGVTAIIFFANSAEARQRWYQLIWHENDHEILEDYFEVTISGSGSQFSERLLSAASKPETCLSTSSRSSQLMNLVSADL